MAVASSAADVANAEEEEVEAKSKKKSLYDGSGAGLANSAEIESKADEVIVWSPEEEEEQGDDREEGDPVDDGEEDSREETLDEVERGRVGGTVERTGTWEVGRESRTGISTRSEVREKLREALDDEEESPSFCQCHSVVAFNDGNSSSSVAPVPVGMSWKLSSTKEVVEADEGT